MNPSVSTHQIGTIPREHHPTEFTTARRGRRLCLRATVSGDGFDEFARKRFEVVVHGAEPRLVEIDGEPVPTVGTRITVANTGTDFTLTFDH